MQSSYDAVANEFAAVNTLIIEQLQSTVSLVEDISQYLVASGGKRIRPLVTLLCAGALGDANSERQIRLATAVEFLHTATLLHDDVVDMSALRRGKPTANANWGNASSVLVGDFVYSRAFQLMVSIGELEVMRLLSDTTTHIAEGEVRQLTLIGDVTLSEADYFDVIRSKTARLFEGGCESSAVIADATDHQRQAVRSYAHHLGLAFQLVDDYLDYAGDSSTLGKHVGDDLAEGKLTLPLITALHNSRENSADDHRVLVNAISEKDRNQIESVMQLTRRHGGLDATQQRAAANVAAASDAITTLPDTVYKTALLNVADFVLSRSH